MKDVFAKTVLSAGALACALFAQGCGSGSDPKTPQCSSYCHDAYLSDKNKGALPSQAKCATTAVCSGQCFWEAMCAKQKSSTDTCTGTAWNPNNVKFPGAGYALPAGVTCSMACNARAKDKTMNLYATFYESNYISACIPVCEKVTKPLCKTFCVNAYESDKKKGALPSQSVCPTNAPCSGEGFWLAKCAEQQSKKATCTGTAWDSDFVRYPPTGFTPPPAKTCKQVCSSMAEDKTKNLFAPYYELAYTTGCIPLCKESTQLPVQSRMEGSTTASDSAEKERTSEPAVATSDPETANSEAKLSVVNAQGAMVKETKEAII